MNENMEIIPELQRLQAMFEEVDLEEAIDEWNKQFEYTEAEDSEMQDILSRTFEADEGEDSSDDNKESEDDKSDDSDTDSDNDAIEIPESDDSDDKKDDSESSETEEGSDPPEPADDDAIEIPGGESDETDDSGDSGYGAVLDEISEKIKFTKAEQEIIDNLIDSETDAISDYSSALNETKNKYARKLYTEILGDESKHLTQLRYLRSMGTGGDYVPKDDAATDELADTLESVTLFNDANLDIL